MIYDSDQSKIFFLMINTDRPILRKHRVQDTDLIVQLATDPAVLQFIRGLPVTREEAWHRLLRYAGHWSLLNSGMFAVFERATDQFIGEVGLADFQRGLGTDFDGRPEAAWLFTGSSHGKEPDRRVYLCDLDKQKP